MSGQLPAAALRSPGLLLSLVLGTLLPPAAWAQLSTGQAKEAQSAVTARVDALTILGGDFGFSDGTFHSVMPLGPGPVTEVYTQVTKIGGDGDIGDPLPLGDTGIGWQPRLQGSMGYLQSANRAGPATDGDSSRLEAASIEFGGGARFWTSEHLSFAPTLMVLYGHAGDTFSPGNPQAVQSVPALTQLGLIDWTIDTVTLRPALNIQYFIPLERARITMSSDIVAFMTRSLARSSPQVDAAGDSGFMMNKIDIDIPLGFALDGHEVRTGGYISRTDLFGELKEGLAVPYLYEVHARLALDFLGQLWRVQWLGVGASYVWGPNFVGWTWGADVTFRF